MNFETVDRGPCPVCPDGRVLEIDHPAFGIAACAKCGGGQMEVAR